MQCVYCIHLFSFSSDCMMTGWVSLLYLVSSDLWRMVTTAVLTLLCDLSLVSKESAPMDLPLTSGVASFPSDACMGFIDSGVMFIKLCMF